MKYIMTNKKRKYIAKETLTILENGYYIHENQKIEVANLTKQSIIDTFTISPVKWEDIEKQDILLNENQTIIEFKNLSTIQALQEEKSKDKIAILNFASAKNPRGGFLGGASAQEESLARSSSLYASLTKDWTMYEYNRSQTSFLYSDYMIYSPNTVFWFDDEGATLAQPILADVITSPAPNKGAMLHRERPNEIQEIEEVFSQRIKKVLHIANQQGAQTLILGAWGCGVFRNDPSLVAQLFKEVIEKHYAKAFKKIVWAIYDRSKEKLVLKAFQEVFDKN
ncbi:TIGR02452 family protein [Flavobacterium columnare]|uniref:TIGR02452 family protein n=1 Tax=Flavobacterium columnare TaxID=996 RepID=UPI0009BE2554|nr:TIGR02452 family protein [Flavobacterium columnare]PDS24310.1 TIGR02452 family protein [Flavobacterium columnare] [Flavobacterium columnare NBRC 100251 = ATCC 23463]